MSKTQAAAVRLAGLALCVSAAAVAFGVWQARQAHELERQLQQGYLRAVQDASDSVSALSIALQKGVYAGTPAQISYLSAQLWRDAGAAKSALASLPARPLALENTYRFLSQVGDYAMSLSRKALNEQEILPQEKAAFASLRSYAESFSQELARLESELSSGSLSLAALTAQDGQEAQPQAEGEDTSGFPAIEAGFEGYAGLLYDGPFSDHMLDRDPLWTQGMAAVPREAARKTAAQMAGRLPEQLSDGWDENSKLPLFCFEAQGVSAAVSKRGGLPVRYSDSREVGSPTLSADRCIQAANTYLQKLGYPSMRESYYETMGGIMTINFAYQLDDVTCYTDLIKVGVAMDNGQVVFLDARGYLFNHYEREALSPTLTQEEAAGILSPALRPERCRLALIPTSGLYELLTYEFLCEGFDGQQVLVYINAETGAEEEILLVVENENGVLTM